MRTPETFNLNACLQQAITEGKPLHLVVTADKRTYIKVEHVKASDPKSD